jgi:hypothetical protein
MSADASDDIVAKAPAGGVLTPLSAYGVQVKSGSYSFVGNGGPTIRGAGPEAWFGPLEPLPPLAPPGTGGRQFDYPFGENLNYIPRADSGISFAELRNLADSLPLLRIVIEKRKDQIAGWAWDIQNRLVGRDRRKPVKPSEAEDPRISSVRELLRKPDRRHHFHVWLRMLVEDMLVIDAATIYPRLNLIGGLHSLDIIDGSTIKPLLDESGRLPLPQDGPAYQQILHGVPAADFDLDELMYLPRNVRSHRLFGMSPVEQIILTVNIALRREVFNLQYYDSGTLPEGFGMLPKEWTADQVKGFQLYFDSLMAGNLVTRRRVRFMPADFRFQEVRQPPLKDQYDEWLARMICAAFSIPHSAFVSDVNRATAQTIQLAAADEGIVPLKLWVKAALDDVIQGLIGFSDLEFVWSGDDQTDPLEQAKADEILVSCGIKQINECRVERGLDAYPGIGPTVSTPVVPLLESLERQLEDLKRTRPSPSRAAQLEGRRK